MEWCIWGYIYLFDLTIIHLALSIVGCWDSPSYRVGTKALAILHDQFTEGHSQRPGAPASQLLTFQRLWKEELPFIESLMSSYAESKRVTKQCSFTDMNWFAFKNTYLHLIILKTVQRDLKIAQCLLCKHEYLSSIPRMHRKSRAWWWALVIPKVGK